MLDSPLVVPFRDLLLKHHHVGSSGKVLEAVFHLQLSNRLEFGAIHEFLHPDYICSFSEGKQNHHVMLPPPRFIMNMEFFGSHFTPKIFLTVILTFPDETITHCQMVWGDFGGLQSSCHLISLSVLSASDRLLLVVTLFTLFVFDGLHRVPWSI